MSHVATIEIEVKDLECLARAAADLGMELRQGQKTYEWYGTSVGNYPIPAGFTAADLGRCEHAIAFAGDARQQITQGPLAGHTHHRNPYEIGVVKRRDGKPGYTLLWDFWSRGYGLQDAIGDNGEKLIQRYAVQVAKKQARLQGYAVREAVKVDGTVDLVLTRRAGT